MEPSRRKLLAAIGLAPLAFVAARSASGAEACYDPAKLPLSQKNRRRGLGYVEVSPDPKKRCDGCAFYTAAKSGCGTCQMLGGGTVSAAAVCNSFAPKG